MRRSSKEQIDNLFWRRRLVVSPSAFEEPSDAALRARGQQGHLRQLDLDGPAVACEQRLLPKIGRKLKSYAKLARTTEEGITVVSPATLPFHGNAAARKLNQKLLYITDRHARKKKENGVADPLDRDPDGRRLIGKFERILRRLSGFRQIRRQLRGPRDQPRDDPPACTTTQSKRPTSSSIRAGNFWRKPPRPRKIVICWSRPSISTTGRKSLPQSR